MKVLEPATDRLRHADLTRASNVSRMFLMASTTTDKVTNSETDTTAEAQPFSLFRFFNRSVHEKTPAPPVKPKGPPKTVWREYFESAVVTLIMFLFLMTCIVQSVKVPTS